MGFPLAGHCCGLAASVQAIEREGARWAPDVGAPPRLHGLAWRRYRQAIAMPVNWQRPVWQRPGNENAITLINQSSINQLMNIRFPRRGGVRWGGGTQISKCFQMARFAGFPGCQVQMCSQVTPSHPRLDAHHRI